MRFGGSDFRPMGTGPGSLKPARAQSTTAPYSALQAYSQTAEGRQYLRDHVTRDDDEQGTYQLAAPHSCTVVAIEDEHVTLHNPHGFNLAGNSTTYSGSVIVITRKEYERNFHRTNFDQAPETTTRPQGHHNPSHPPWKRLHDNTMNRRQHRRAQSTNGHSESKPHPPSRLIFTEFPNQHSETPGAKLMLTTAPEGPPGTLEPESGAGSTSSRVTAPMPSIWMLSPRRRSNLVGPPPSAGAHLRRRRPPPAAGTTTPPPPPAPAETTTSPSSLSRRALTATHPATGRKQEQASESRSAATRRTPAEQHLEGPAHRLQKTTENIPSNHQIHPRTHNHLRPMNKPPCLTF